MEKSDVNATAVFFVKMLKKQKLINNWEDACYSYNKACGQTITPEELKKIAPKIKLSDVDQELFNKYTVRHQTYLRKDEVKDERQGQPLTVLKPKVEDSNIVHMNAIPASDFGPIFGIFPTDTDEEKLRKIKLKFADDNFYLRYNGFDPNIVEVQKRIPCAWNTSMKIREEDGHENVYMVINESDRVIIRKRKTPIYVNDEHNRNIMLEDLREFLKKQLITPFDLFSEKQSNKKTDGLNDNLCVVCPGLELHLGKLGAKEDYENYSSKQALWRVRYLAQELYNYQQKNNAGTLVIGVGNDFYNSDTLDDKTPAGTQQNNDTRYKSMYLWGVVSYMSLIESMRPYFNKIVLKFNPGNHDEKSAFSLYTQLYMEYADKKDKKVVVDGDEKEAPVEIGMNYNDIRFNNAYVFGNNLFVFAHSKTPNSKYFNDTSLAQLAINTFNDEYHSTKNTYIFAGHIHQDGETKVKNTTVTVLRTPSLGGHGSWDAENAYLDAREGHTLYLIDKEEGYMGKQYVTISKKDKDKKINSINLYDENIIHGMRNALNVTSEALSVKRCKDTIGHLEEDIDEKKKKHIDVINKIVEITGGKEPTKEQVDEILNTMGYNEEISDQKEQLNQTQKVLQLHFDKHNKK